MRASSRFLKRATLVAGFAAVACLSAGPGWALEAPTTLIDEILESPEAAPPSDENVSDPSLPAAETGGPPAPSQENEGADAEAGEQTSGGSGSAGSGSGGTGSSSGLSSSSGTTTHGGHGSTSDPASAEQDAAAAETGRTAPGYPTAATTAVTAAAERAAQLSVPFAVPLTLALAAFVAVAILGRRGAIAKLDDDCSPGVRL